MDYLDVEEPCRAVAAVAACLEDSAHISSTLNFQWLLGMSFPAFAYCNSYSRITLMTARVVNISLNNPQRYLTGISHFRGVG